jgi:small subunit ribosomal protein S20
MPIIANAKKALRQSKTRNARNRIVRATVRVAAKKTTQTADPSMLSKLFSAVDKAVKKNIIHKNKAARMKSRAAKRIGAEVPVKTTKPKAAAKKKAVKKPAKKK